MKKRNTILILIMSIFFVTPVKAMKVVECGGLDSVPYKPLAFVGTIIKILQIAVPILLIIMGMLDFSKAVTASETKKMDELLKIFIKRVIYAILVFFVVAIVKFVFGMLGTDENVFSCASCVLGGECNPVELKVGGDSTPVDDMTQEERTENAKKAADQANAARKKAQDEALEAKAKADKNAQSKKTTTNNNKQFNETAVKAVAYAQTFVGRSYVYGGTWNGELPYTPTDCSGFVKGVYAHYNHNLPRTSSEQAADKSLKDVIVNKDNLQPGDLIFYGSGNKVSHVVMYIGNGNVVHASSPKEGIKISKYDYRTPIKAKRVVK